MGRVFGLADPAITKDKHQKRRRDSGSMKTELVRRITGDFEVHARQTETGVPTVSQVSGHLITDHFVGVNKMVNLGPGTTRLCRAGWRVLKPTVAGFVLFSATMAQLRCFPMVRVDYIRVPGRQSGENPDHRFDTLEFRVPWFTASRRATNTVRDELVQSFSLPEGVLARRDEPTPPLRAIREAVVNAVMHRSYHIHGAAESHANRLLCKVRRSDRELQQRQPQH
jgi:hypothetical protein